MKLCAVSVRFINFTMFYAFLCRNYLFDAVFIVEHVERPVFCAILAQKTSLSACFTMKTASKRCSAQKSIKHVKVDKPDRNDPRVMNRNRNRPGSSCFFLVLPYPLPHYLYPVPPPITHYPHPPPITPGTTTLAVGASGAVHRAAAAADVQEWSTRLLSESTNLPCPLKHGTIRCFTGFRVLTNGQF